MNQARREVIDTAQSLGYACPSWISSRALTWPDLSIGEHCLIFDGVNIQPFARLGNNCIVRSGAVLSHDAELGDDCLIACGAIIGGAAKIGDGLGLNCTIRDKVSVAAGSFIAAGAVVTADIPRPGYMPASLHAASRTLRACDRASRHAETLALPASRHRHRLRRPETPRSDVPTTVHRYRPARAGCGGRLLPRCGRGRAR